MQLTIMQPYFFPYLGYWQMLNAADKFLIYDDVNYIKGGWINRNNLLSDGTRHLFTLGLSGASPFKKINEIQINPSPENRNKVLGFIRNAYLKAPYFKTVFPLIEEIVSFPENDLTLYLKNQFHRIFDVLGIRTEIRLSSEVKKDDTLKAQDRVLDICRRLEASEYINAIGGMALYSKEEFARDGITLKFIRMKEITYPQFKNDFVPNLSIIDVMMFNPPETVNKMLNEYELL